MSCVLCLGIGILQAGNLPTLHLSWFDTHLIHIITFSELATSVQLYASRCGL